jgi:hypothetical protein
MWVLILTVAFNGNGVAVSHVDGFTSRDVCLAAGNFYMDKTNSNIYRLRLSASCVSK